CASIVGSRAETARAHSGRRGTAKLIVPTRPPLAVPWMKVLTPEDLLRRLGHDVLLSKAAPRDLLERQQTMNATVAWTYQAARPPRRDGAAIARWPAAT